MRIAIHKSAWSFSADWIDYCELNNVQYKIVDCYRNNIIQQLKGCDVLMWHHHHTLAKDKIFAKHLLYALEQSGMKVFPDFRTNWHFDDKLGQKYLLEAIDAPIPDTYVFYKKESANEWLEKTSFPKVFKLRGGAGSTNVHLVSNKKQGRKLVEKAFNRGFSNYARWGDFKENWRKYRMGLIQRIELLKSIRRLFFSTEFARIHGKEKGYVLFQKFIPNNSFDIRVIIIGDKAFAIKRIVRANDFRASGGGEIHYDKDEIDERCIKLAFSVTTKLKAQCVAFDFVFSPENAPLIVEINYGFAKEGYTKCPGYWDHLLVWHEGEFNPVHWMIDVVIKDIKNNH